MATSECSLWFCTRKPVKDGLCQRHLDIRDQKADRQRRRYLANVQLFEESEAVMNELAEHGILTDTPTWDKPQLVIPREFWPTLAEILRTAGTIARCPECGLLHDLSDCNEPGCDCCAAILAESAVG